MKNPTLSRAKDYWIGHFQAMANPCEILFDTRNAKQARQLLQLAHDETRRIEQALSRYRDNNIIYRINHAKGHAITVDDELAGLLDYAAQCYQISDGMFDITSGILREAWRFDGSDNIPSQEKITKLLPRIGWEKITWQRPKISLPEGMEIDLGGIGKEYAVDRTALLLKQQSEISMLINFGGDLYATGPRQDGHGWMVGVENPEFEHASKTEKQQHATQQYELVRGGIATSGDARRFLLKDGIRYGHILAPKTGWPVVNAPHSITVLSDTCTEAGILATLAMLHGKEAEEFLTAQQIKFWCQR